MRYWIIILTMLSTMAHADWNLQQPSQLTFTTTKNTYLTEIHHFRQLQGSVMDNGYAELSIDLNSVDTGIPVRDERMKSMLFDISSFATATLKTQLDPTLLKKVKKGEVLATELDAQLTLHGIEKSIKAPVIIARTADGSLLVSSSEPVLINADQFDLSAGVEKLREVAGLKSIEAVVPVSFTLTFREQ